MGLRAVACKESQCQRWILLGIGVVGQLVGLRPHRCEPVGDGVHCHVDLVVVLVELSAQYLIVGHPLVQVVVVGLTGCHVSLPPKN